MISYADDESEAPIWDEEAELHFRTLDLSFALFLPSAKNSFDRGGRPPLGFGMPGDCACFARRMAQDAGTIFASV